MIKDSEIVRLKLNLDSEVTSEFIQALTGQ